MKLLKALSTVVLVLLPQLAQASEYRCTETDSRKATKMEVLFTEIKDITNQVSYGRHYDKIYLVGVSLFSIKGATRTRLKSFKATANTEDVMYTISSIRENGFQLNMFLDEADDAHMTLTLPNGTKSVHHMTCGLARQF